MQLPLALPESALAAAATADRHTGGRLRVLSVNLARLAAINAKNGVGRSSKPLARQNTFLATGVPATAPDAAAAAVPVVLLAWRMASAWVEAHHTRDRDLPPPRWLRRRAGGKEKWRWRAASCLHTSAK